MIFFILPRGSEDFDPIRKINVRFAKELRLRQGFVIVSWNEVYETVDDMLRATLEAAEADPVCQSYVKRFQTIYGFSLLTADNPLSKKIRQTFFYWAHPLIGNLVNSPRIRPLLRAFQYRANWMNSDALSDASRNAILRLLRVMPRLERASRDQCRICCNIVELARAFIGEMTCYATRKMEKILALRLCLSPSLLQTQRSMLLTYWKSARCSVALATVQKTGVKALEYGRYYLPNDASDDIVGAPAVALFTAMVASALGDEPDLTDSGIDQELGQRCIRAWTRLPPVIRCVVLMNDLRKLDDVRKLKQEPGERVSMATPDIERMTAPTKGEQCYCVVPAAGHQHVVKFVSSGRDLTWSWNRDEAHPATITYRYNLCPLWAGASGHTVGGINFWSFVLGEQFPDNGALIVCAGLFTLWRLYYDRRISGAHTLVETLEASCLEADTRSVHGGEKPVEIVDDDAFAFIWRSSFPGNNRRLCADPIRIMHLLMHNLPKDLDNLDRVLTVAQEAVAKHYWLPRWSHELSETTGVDVEGYELSLDAPQEVEIDEPDTEGLLPLETEIVVTFDRDPGHFHMAVGDFGTFRVFGATRVEGPGFRYRAVTTAVTQDEACPLSVWIQNSEEDDVITFKLFAKTMISGGTPVALELVL